MFKSLQRDEEKDIPILDEINTENQFNIDKYKHSGEIAEQALVYAKSLVAPDKLIIDICISVDLFIADKLKEVYSNKIFSTGVAFPTCISINNVVGNFSPVVSDTTVLNCGDLVKIKLGVHIDGFPVIVGDTVMIGEPNEKQKRVMECLNDVRNNIKSLVKIHKHSNGVYNYMNDITKTYECELLDCDETIDNCSGIFSYQVSQDIISGRNDKSPDHEQHKMIFHGQNRHDYDIEDFQFEHNQVFIMDVSVSSGNGYVNICDHKDTTIYKHNFDTFYNLKLQASRHTCNEFKKRGCFPTTVRDFQDNKIKLGLVECYKSNVLDAYPVLYEKPDEYVGNYTFTLILRQGNKKKKNRNIYFN